jgi:ATP-dependent Lon protease
MSDELPAQLTLPVLPLDDTVVLPGMVVPIRLSGGDSGTEARAAIDAAQAGSEPDTKSRLLLVPRTDGRYAAVGTMAVIEQLGRLPGGERAAVLRGLARVRIGSGTTGPGAALWVQADVVEESIDDPRTADLAKEYKALVTTILQQRGAWQVVDSVQQVDGPAALADLAGYAPYVTAEQKLWLLETTDVAQRLSKLLVWGREYLAELDVAETIRKDVSEGMERQQREFLLRQQLAAIRKELADLDGKPASEEQDYRAKVEAANLPEKVREAALSEVDKLERTSEQSPEIGWIRTWLDTVLEIAWNERTPDNYDIGGAREILDADHAGLDDVKDRIIEYLAVRKRRSDRGLGVIGGRRSGAVLALVGPPGVGKTSLGESVARAMGRKFVRVALGGGTRRGSVATGAPMSVPCRAGLSGPSPRPVQ